MSIHLFALSQIRVIDNKGTLNTIDASKWTLSGSNIYLKQTGNVGIGTNLPLAKLHVNGSILFETTVITDKPFGGVIGSSVATVDIYTSINLNQNTPGQTLSLPTPTNPAAGRILQVNNIGTTSVTIGSVTINANKTASFVWNGAVWAETTQVISLTTIGISGPATLNSNILNIPNYTLPVATGSTLGGVKVGSGLSVDGTGLISATNNGTVTSVGLSLPTEMTVTNSPITSSGALTAAWASQTAKKFFAAPNAADGTPTFRTIDATDIPTLNQNTTGSAASFTGSLVGDVTGTQGATVVGKINGASLAALATGILKNTTATGVPTIAVAADFPTLNQNTTGTAASAASFTGSLVGDVTGSQGATVVGKINGTSLAGLTTGILKNTTTTGVPTIAVAGTDYLTPTGSAASLTNFPTLNQNTTGTAASAASFTGSLAGDVTGSQGATVVGKINGASLAALATGILKNTTATGVPTIAVAADFPILNQNTTGTAASAASFTGSLVGDVTGTQGATVVGKINGASLAALTTGILKNTTTTGVPTIAVAGTDYLTPTGSAASLTNFPTLNQNTTGTAANVTGTVAAANGGTGLSSITTNNLMYGAGTSAVSLLAPHATTGAILMSTVSGAPSWSLLNGLPTTAGTLLVANGGTGSNTQNWVDLTTAQASIGGAKTWTSLGTFSAGLTASGAAVSINDNSNFATTINTGTSTGTVNIASGTIGGNAITIGNNVGATSLTQRVGTGNYSLDGVGASIYTIGASTTSGIIVIGGSAQTGALTLGSSTAAQTVNLGTGAGASTVNIANGIAGNIVSIANGTNTAAQTINIGAGASAANNTINIGSGVNTAGVTAVTIGTNTNLANTTTIEGGSGIGAINLTPQTTGSIVIGASAGTGGITLGNSTAAQTVNVGTGAGASTVNIANGTAGNIVSIANGTNTAAQTINIGAGASAANNTINIGSGANTAGVTAVTVGTNTNLANTTTIEGGSGTGAISLTPQTTGSIVIGAPAGTGDITLGNSTDAQTVNVLNGVSAANQTVNILSGAGTNGVGAINLGDNPRVTTIDIGNTAPAAARTTTIAGGNAAVVDQINIGTGSATVAGGKTVNIGTTAPTGSGTNIITIGAPSTVARNGVRFGTSRVVKNYPTPPTTGGTVTLTVAQVLDAGIYVANANATVTFPTAASLLAAMPSPQIGDVITFAIATSGNFTPTIAVGAGGTIGSQTTGVARVTRYLSIRLTNVTTGSEAYTIY